MDKDKIRFKRKVRAVGTDKRSLTQTYPPEVVNYLGLEEGSDVVIMPDVNKDGKKFVAIWKDEDAETDNN